MDMTWNNVWRRKPLWYHYQIHQVYLSYLYLDPHMYVYQELLDVLLITKKNSESDLISSVETPVSSFIVSKLY